MKYERPKLDPTPEDTPPVIHPKTPPAIVSSPSTVSPPPPPIPPLTNLDPPAVAVPVILPTASKPDYPAPILSELLSPTSIDLVTASGLTISGENGEQISFGALFRDRKVVVIFIRHFWCLFCQDYIRSITNSVSPETLKKKGVDLVLIGNGAPGMIRAYKSKLSAPYNRRNQSHRTPETLKVPFTVYTDSSLQLHDALGLYKSSTVRTGCSRKQAAGRNYVKRNGRWTSLRIAVRAAAAKAVHNGSGDFEQLGGEFVFGPG
jgi:peroxiredoxin